MAISALKDAISFLDSNRAGDYYFELGDYYSHTTDTDSAALYFTKAIKRGYPLTWIKSGYPTIYSKIDSAKIQKYILDLKAKIDFDLYDKFVQINALDQAVRDGTLYPINDIFHGTPEQKAFIDTMSIRVDSNTFEFVKQVLEKYKYPIAYNLGFYPSGFMGLLLHITAVDNARSRNLFAILEELNRTCNFPQKSIILFLKDRQKLYNEHNSCCGLFGGINRYSDIVDVNKADSIRLSYNQLRLKEETSRDDTTSIRNRSELRSKGYKPKPYPKKYFCIEKYHFD
ncbi:MAG TPA: hypothetical protein VN721_02685 [Flavipsychrobacter sp.]|nr:hypothetical protein [Flavipsychrobacter sp.]